MASRQEEKEARRQARLEQEAAEQRATSRSRRLQLLFGAVLGVGIIAAVVIAVVASSGGDSETEAKAPSQAATSGAAAIPAADLTDMTAAAKAAGCTLGNPPDEGNNHEQRTFKPSDYNTNPPTSGNHFPEWAEDGVYEPANTPPLGKLVHTLEHGRIDVQYRPGTPQRTVDRLETLLGELDSGYHMLLFQNPTGMKAEVAATTWDHSLTCDKMNDRVFDAIRTFRQQYIDKGPEKVA